MKLSTVLLLVLLGAGCAPGTFTRVATGIGRVCAPAAFAEAQRVGAIVDTGGKDWFVDLQAAIDGVAGALDCYEAVMAPAALPAGGKVDTAKIERRRIAAAYIGHERARRNGSAAAGP